MLAGIVESLCSADGTIVALQQLGTCRKMRQAKLYRVVACPIWGQPAKIGEF